MAAAAKAQEEARKQADEGNVEAAKDLLRSAVQDLRARAPRSPKADELLNQVAEMEGPWTSWLLPPMTRTRESRCCTTR